MKKSRKRIDLSVVIPSYRHASVLEANLPLLLDFLKGLPLRTEVIVSDDGSNDGGQTRAVAQRLGCRFVALPQNQGKGAAVRLGMRAALGNICFFTDADIPFELEAIERFYHYLTFKEFQLAVGDRNLEASSYNLKVPLLRRLGSAIYSAIVGSFIAGGWYDTQCGLKGFQAAAAKDLFSVGRVNRFGFDVELLHVAIKRNYDIKRLPVTLRNQGPSSVRLVRDSFRMFVDLGLLYCYQLAGRYKNPPAPSMTSVPLRLAIQPGARVNPRARRPSRRAGKPAARSRA